MDTLLVKNLISHGDVVKIASDCLRQKVQAISKIGGGANNKVFRVDCPEGQYVVKFYFRHPLDSRDRLGIEFESFSFLWEHGLRVIPRPVALCRQYHCAFYEFIEGKAPGGDILEKNIDAAADFLGILKKLSAHPLAMNLSPASEAFFSFKTIVNSIQVRLDRIDDKISGEEYDQLHRYLNEEFIPLFATVVKWSGDHLEENRIPDEAVLPREFRTLSPSDFGFHNSLRMDGGKIVFLDFEYFGWDDPAKLVSDFLWHPAMDLSENLKTYFVRRMNVVFSKDPYFKARLKGVFPLFGLKWCLIFLNEFISTDSDLRDFAHSPVKDKITVRHEQLRKAMLLNNKIKAMYKDFPYGS